MAEQTNLATAIAQLVQFINKLPSNKQFVKLLKYRTASAKRKADVVDQHKQQQLKNSSKDQTNPSVGMGSFEYWKRLLKNDKRVG